MKRFYTYFQENPVWAKVILFNLTLFLIWLADGIIAYWAPVQIETTVNNSFLMGLIISFQSVIGLMADIVFPKLLKSFSARKLVYLGIIFVGITTFLLAGSVFKPLIAIFLLTMVFWGTYYEFIAFANYQFMGSVVPAQLRSGAWGINGIFLNLAYFIGPLIATFLLGKSYIWAGVVVLIFLLLSFIVHNFTKGVHEPVTEVDLKEVNPWKELKHWLSLSKVVWPMIIMSITLGFVDSTFWTIGAVWTEKLSKVNAWGALFLPLYMLPAIFVGLIIAKLHIQSGKKRLSECVLIVAGIFMMLLGFNLGTFWQLGMVIMSALALAVCYPLVQGVYSDLVARMGREKKEMIGLTNSVINLAYIIWPPIAGFISVQIGERLTFSYLGLLVALVAIGLLFVTPRKLHLPEKEIRSWE